MLFDGPRAELPVATLEPAVRGSRLRADFDRWVMARGAWLQPRLVPLVVACAGLFATLGAVQAIGAWQHEAPLRLPVHGRLTVTAPHHAPRGHEPVRLLLRPIAPGDRYLELTIGTPDSR
jgi:cytochrome c-type biogenesis protein CcmH/NrfG